MADHRLMMKPQDLLELYQLLALYQRTYDEGGEKSLSGWMDDISGHFKDRTRGGDIKKPVIPGMPDAENAIQSHRIRRFWYSIGMGIPSDA